MDILSGLPTATAGSKCILVLVDAFTKWVEAYALPDQEAATCMNAAYTKFFSRFGYPLQLHSDQGRNFESTLVKELYTLIWQDGGLFACFERRSVFSSEYVQQNACQDT